MKEKYLKALEKLFKEAQDLGVKELVRKVYSIGFSQGYDYAVERFEEEI